MKVVLKNVRLTFPHLFKPRAFEEGGNARYSANLLIELGSENDKAVKAAIKEVAIAGFDKKAEAFLKSAENNSQKMCYVTGELKGSDEAEGLMVLSAYRYPEQGAPVVVDRNKEKLGSEDGKPYSGCYVNASVDIWAQTKNYPGIRCGLNAIQFFEDGEPLAGAPATADDFEELGGGDEDGDFTDFK